MLYINIIVLISERKIRFSVNKMQVKIRILKIL